MTLQQRPEKVKKEYEYLGEHGSSRRRGRCKHWRRSMRGAIEDSREAISYRRMIQKESWEKE